MVGRKIIWCFCPFAVEFLYCDLASLKSIQQFVQKFKKKKIPLHVLVNNGESWGNPDVNSDTDMHSSYPGREDFGKVGFSRKFMSICAVVTVALLH